MRNPSLAGGRAFTLPLAIVLERALRRMFDDLGPDPQAAIDIREWQNAANRLHRTTHDRRSGTLPFGSGVHDWWRYDLMPSAAANGNAETSFSLHRVLVRSRKHVFVVTAK